MIPNGPYEACEPLAYLCPPQIREMARSLALQRVQRAGRGLDNGHGWTDPHWGVAAAQLHA